MSKQPLGAILLCGVAVLLSIGVALVAPTDVLDRLAPLAMLTNAIAAIVPAVEQFEKTSSAPQVTRLVVALQWALVPVYAAFFFSQLTPSPSGFAALSRIKYLVPIQASSARAAA